MMSQQQGESTLKAAAQKAMDTAVEQGGLNISSNVEVAEKLDSLKMKDELPADKLTDTGKELAAQVERLAEDTKRIFLDKNREEDLQKAALHASRAAQIARRHQLVTTKEGEQALEEARKGMYSGLNLARLIVMSAEFRDELADGLGIIVDSLRVRGGTPRRGGEGATGQGKLKRSDAMDWTSEEEEEEEEEGALGGGQGEEQAAAGGLTQALKGTGGKKYQALSQEQQDQIAERFYKLMRKLQSKPEYQRGISYLLEKVRTVQEKGGLHAERMEQQLRETGPGRAFMEEASKAKDHAIRLVENWIEGSLDPLFNHISSIATKMQSDEETRRELSHLGHFVETCLKSPEVLTHEEAVKKEARERFNAVRERMLQQYEEPATRLKEELIYLRDEFREDEAAQVLQRDVKDLVNTILYDEQGQPTVKVELIRDLEYILSAFVKRVQFIPVPRVAVTTPDYDLVADGIVINIRELTPKQIHLETLTKVHDRELEQGKSPLESSSSAEPIELETFILMHLTGITADLKDVHWYYNKKTGMIQEHDRGRADFKIYGRGLSVDLDLQPTVPVATKEKPIAHSIEVLRAKANVHRMSLRVYDSKHDWVYAIFKPIIKSQIKAALEQAVEDYMKDYLQRLDRDTTLSMVGQYPATKAVDVEKKDVPTTGLGSSTTTSSTGDQAQVPVMTTAPEMPE